MLILAGVSINAIVGDNGILSKATDAVYLNSCAYLEEYFNQLYATCAIDGNIDGETPLETIMKNGYQNYFFSTSEGYCLKKNYTNSETGETQTLVLYLVKKEELPEEIRNQIKGADNLESRDYRKLTGVYGITSDLKAYYCQSGIDSMLGLTTSDLNADSPDIVYADENSTLAQIINGGTAPITNQGLKSIKTLTIDTTEKLVLLQDFKKFPNITSVVFKNISIPNLIGIEGALESLIDIRFINCSVQDYSALNSLSNLKKLYLITPTDKNADIARLGSTDKGIANAEFSKLQYFGIVGHASYLETTTTSYATNRYDITDISSLANFSKTTKEAIKFLYLQNLQLTSIEALSDFINVYTIRLEENALTTLNGIQNMWNLHYLIAPSIYSNTSKSYSLGKNEIDTISATDALSYIYKDDEGKNTNLIYVDLRSNQKLKQIEYLSSCIGIKTLYLDGITSLVNIESISQIIAQCGTNYSISGNYGLSIISNTSKCLKLSGTIKISDFEKLKNNTNLTHLSLYSLNITTDDGVKLTTTTSPTFNEEVNSVLNTCTSLQYLQLYNLSNLTTIDFVGQNKVTKLIELDLRGTKVTDLTSLNTYATAIKTLVLNNENTNIEAIQPTMNRCRTGVKYWSGKYSGIILANWNLLKKLENCTSADFKNFYNYYGFASITEGTTKVLDLSNTKIEYVNIFGYLCNMVYPNTLKAIHQDQSALPTFSENSLSTTKIEIVWNCARHTNEQWKECLQSMSQLTNLRELYIHFDQAFRFADLSYLSNLENLTTFRYTADNLNNEYTDISEKRDITGIGNLSHLTTIKLNNLNELYDISDLYRCQNLVTLELVNSKVSDLSALANLTNLKTLKLNNNAITDIYPLRNLSKLESLNLENNLLTDISYYKNENGQSIGYEVMDILYDLNQIKKGKLKELYISGNSFDDTEILLDLTWSKKSGF
ncbi:MAG: leucine-rich repeat domain-containing protein [Clostridia bacterium]|nr:leucine-rich repeat domain-containing protein [Clostridia bacterium]